ncbi:MAG: patatin-like phospholipase family protein [Alphaproteobacteria bacterium]|nr:patatin-like phospholipase family protein [Alphaproteobacteria bacterium]MBV9370643.1 patatin-like phospholipase family protein [Alphaproteobacteria bacterium]MBV9899993.1 patatin-like phospholipase family protein [Alphaproteobacteria bacterium]
MAEAASAAQGTGGDGVPALECDLVMKGGITSGIVYPGAIAEIAARYRIRSIGGTSAGAIAAAAAAGMEFGRASGRNPGAVEKMRGVPAELGADAGGAPLLNRLFEPDKATAPLLAPVLLLLRADRASRIRGIVALAGLPLLLAALFAGGLLYAAGVRHRPGDAVAWIGVSILALLLFLLLLAAFIVLLRVRGPLAAVANDGFGFCSGMACGRGAGGAALPSLTGWLHGQIQSLAGLPADEPLTFGDLWAARLRTAARTREAAFAEALAQSGAAELALCGRDVDLKLVASDLSRSLALQFPFMPGAGNVYIRSDDLAQLFPAEVVRWMTSPAIGPALDEVPPGILPDGVRLHRLPRAADMPVLFASRISMSFPLLFSAVRLYLRRFRPAAQGGGAELLELWLADGGITSNFPVHLFDSPLPTRPTFCLNLLYPGDEVGTNAAAASGNEGEEAGAAAAGAAPLAGEDQAQHIRMARTNRSELLILRQMLPGSPIARLLAWGGRILYTARQWGDITAMGAPGYRDRIVHIRMLAGEGGLNLGMGAAQLAALDRRGAIAGRVIAERFLPGTNMDPLYGGPLRLNWSNHRFVRFRTFAAGLEDAARRFAGGWKRDFERGELPASDPAALHPNVQEMIEKAGRKGAPLPQAVGYGFSSDAQRHLAEDLVAAVRAIDDKCREEGSLAIGSPRPTLALKLRPPLDRDPQG